MKIDVDWKKAGLAGGNLALVLSDVSFLTPAVDIVAAISKRAKTPPTAGEKAADWLGRALAASILGIFEEARSHHEAEQKKDRKDRNDRYLLTAGLPTTLEDIFIDPESLPSSFLERPDQLNVWDQVGEAVLTALKEAGYGETLGEVPESQAYLSDWIRMDLAGDLPDRFVEHLHTFWRTLGLGDDGSVQSFFTMPTGEAAKAASQWRAYRRKLIGWPNEPATNRLFGGAFPIADLYVPLRGYEVDDPGGFGHDHDVRRPGDGGPRKPARHFDLMERTGLWLQESTDEDGLAVVSGGPGSGKSTLARMFAARMAVRPDYRVIFMPLHQVKGASTWVDAVSKFADTEDLPKTLLSEQRQVLAILDGIDEMQTLGKSVSVSRDLFGTLGDSLGTGRTRALALGRDVGVSNVMSALGAITPKRMHVAPLICDEELRGRFDWTASERPDFDLQRDWWARYAAARPQSPASSHITDDLLKAQKDLTAYPVLNGLLALMIETWDADRDGPLDLPKLSAARLYHRVMQGTHKREWGTPSGGRLNLLGNFPRFMRFLEEVAFAAFRDDTRTATLEDVSRTLGDPEIVAELGEALRHDGGIDNHTHLPDLAVMAFHFRFVTDTGVGRLEFTHKSFADYLLARRILRAADEGLKEKAWAKTFGDVMVTIEVLNFLRQEVHRRVWTRDDAVDPELTIARCDEIVNDLADLLARSTGQGFSLPEPITGWTEAGLRRRGTDAELALLVAIDALCRAQDLGPEKDGTLLEDVKPEDRGTWTLGRAKVPWPSEWAARAMIQRQYERALPLQEGGYRCDI